MYIVITNLVESSGFKEKARQSTKDVTLRSSIDDKTTEKKKKKKIVHELFNLTGPLNRLLMLSFVLNESFFKKIVFLFFNIGSIRKTSSRKTIFREQKILLKI